MRRSYLSLLVVFAVLISSNVFAQDVVIATGEYPPYTSENLDDNGFSAEIVRSAFAEEGISVKYEFMPWKRCEASVENGDYYGAIPYLKTEERLKAFSYSDPFYISRSSFFFMKDSFSEVEYSKLEDLKKYAIAGTAGYYYEKMFTDAGLNIEYSDDAKSSLKKLHAGRVDLFPEDDLAAWAMIKELFPGEEGKFAASSRPFNEDPHYVMVSKKFQGAEDITAKFNSGLQKLKASGKYDVIMKKYGLK